MPEVLVVVSTALPAEEAERVIQTDALRDRKPTSGEGDRGGSILSFWVEAETLHAGIPAGAQVLREALEEAGLEPDPHRPTVTMTFSRG